MSIIDFGQLLLYCVGLESLGKSDVYVFAIVQLGAKNIINFFSD